MTARQMASSSSGVHPEAQPPRWLLGSALLGMAAHQGAARCSKAPATAFMHGASKGLHDRKIGTGHVHAASASARPAAGPRRTDDEGRLKSSCLSSAAVVGAGCGVACLKHGRRRGRKGVARRFFPFMEPEPEVDPDDPGRPAMCGDYQRGGGRLVTAERSDFGWTLVKGYNASEQDEYWHGEAPGKVTQEWREMLLARAKDDSDKPPEEGKGQSVVKVSVCDGEAPIQVPYCMALGYTKSMCTIALTGAQAQGALPMDDLPQQRALVVGLGAGSMPLWLEHTFPEGKIAVDALEIDPAVIEMATKSMGFPEKLLRPVAVGDAAAAAKDAASGADGAAVRVYTCGGESFIEELAKLAPKDYLYDYVFIDAFDNMGKVPEVLVTADGPFLPALKGLLAPKATIVLNLLVGMTGRGSSGGPKEIEEMVSAIHGTCCSESAEVFTVRTPVIESSGNQLFGFFTAGRPSDQREKPLKEALVEAGDAVNADFPVDAYGSKIRFEFARRLTFGYEGWQPGGAAAESQKQGGGFGFF
mmetsp:Transcript_46822/g.111394  ORF Transcript_46822/g.111394 Transcript_46822/m.111394 type:complete len:530 (+) Transcript_46822:74-1663(+)|eukprot:CAMPEP_0178390072 /NCGR_PEP_ID=MMETSP0689_2-20121128/10455_1 /TAXON_ID=160604 /ORGANISM="Amphidinium massartii, Strain CS-259" /LENGTH=529 /DNA_ID=CAMNT_0020010565 /DNA_START=36 /DNA_END=1625 /DNA_ORIENTATION=+